MVHCHFCSRNQICSGSWNLRTGILQFAPQPSSSTIPSDLKPQLTLTAFSTHPTSPAHFYPNMGRASKFSFPIPGRRHRGQKDVDGRTPREQDPAQPSKVERLLGASHLAIRQATRSQPPLRSTPIPVSNPPQSPSYMTVTLSEASFGSDYADRVSSTAVEDIVIPPRWRSLQNLRPCPSSNILGGIYDDERGRSGSIGSSNTRRIHTQDSSSTLQSYYDAQKSPLAVSQQTSASAVRDMALRKGYPPIVEKGEHSSTYTNDHESQNNTEKLKKQGRKHRPARLDLSKLFPKPKGPGGVHSEALLSPNKLVNSPLPLSDTSEYFPRNVPNPAPEPRARSTKSTKHSEKSHAAPRKKSSKEKSFQRDIYDNAKVNVRRPPRGIQHWFDGLEEDNDDYMEEPDTPAPPPLPMNIRAPNLAPVRKSSLGRVLVTEVEAPKKERPQTPRLGPATGKEIFTKSSQVRTHRRNSPSLHSITSHTTATSAKTKESKFSTSNLQDSSVLSMSSSSDEEYGESPKKFPVLRDSLARSADISGEIIIGKAQAFEVNPRTKTSGAAKQKRPDVMISLEAHPSYLALPRHSRNKKSTHSRQPSAIPEDETRPRTSGVSNSTPTGPMSPSSINASLHSGKTSMSEPLARNEQHRLMAVTEEEEALLEMMRRKRAAMAKHSFTEGYKTALKKGQLQLQRRGDTPTPTSYESMPRTSGFLAMDSPPSGTIHGFPRPASTRSGRVSLSGSDTLTSPGSGPTSSRGRPRQPRKTSSTMVSGMLRDTSSSDSNAPSHNHFLAGSDSSASLPCHLSPAPDFSPLDPFQSPTRTTTTASMASPTTVSHASPLPSPVTPGPRNGELDVHVKVAGSEPSCNGDEEVGISSTGIVEPLINSVEKDHERNRTSYASTRTRRRTASSGAEVVYEIDESQKPQERQQSDKRNQKHVMHQFQHAQFDIEESSEVLELYPTEQKSMHVRAPRRTSSIATANRSGRTSTISITSPTTPTTRERSVRESRVSKASRLSRENSTAKRESIAPGTVSTRCSVSEDVLAAWGSLGGWRDFDSGRIHGL